MSRIDQLLRILAALDGHFSGSPTHPQTLVLTPGVQNDRKWIVVVRALKALGYSF